MSTLPLVDLRWQFAQMGGAAMSRIHELSAAGAFILGPEVQAFEREFAAYLQIPHVLGVANGTDALELALRAGGIEAGDEVILPANTFVATALAVTRIGGIPVFADVDASFGLLDPRSVNQRVTKKTRAVIAVHLWGQMAPMEPLLSLCKKHGLLLFEDAAQAHGAKQEGRLAGSIGVAAGFSFYPGKNLGAFGDAGAVATTDEGMAARVRSLRNYGGTEKYVHTELGFNSRLDALQAAVLREKLPMLDEWNTLRAEAAGRYEAMLKPLSWLRTPQVAPGNEHVWHLYVVRCAERDRVLALLNAAGVQAAIHYPIPLHQQGVFASLGYRAGDFPNAEAFCSSILSLPLFPGITIADQSRVAAVLGDVRW